LLVGGVFFFIKEPAKPAGKCGPYREDKTVHLGSVRLKAESVQGQSEITKGLGGRPCIEQDRAMLFEFSKPGQYAIWMKDMKFPIDILWISPGRKVVGLEKNVKPDTYPDSFANKDQKALYVLETKAGLAEKHSIGLGSPVSW